MTLIRTSFLALLLASLPASAAPLADDADDWRLIGGMLALVQKVIHAAASPDPGAADAKVAEMLAGRDAEANRAAAGAIEEALREVPAEHRATFAAIGRDLLALARREHARSAAAAGEAAATQDAIRARKELHAMGLRYWDAQQFEDARRRGDRIALELYRAARGLPGQAGASTPPPAR